jgi:hypothetical protein
MVAGFRDEERDVTLILVVRLRVAEIGALPEA